MEENENINYFVCNGANKTDIHSHKQLCVNISKLCVNGLYNEVLGCIPHLDEQRSYRIALGVWSIIVTIFGLFGNLFTLLAIPYAAKRQR